MKKETNEINEQLKSMRYLRHDFIKYLFDMGCYNKKQLSWIIKGSTVAILRDYPYEVMFFFEKENLPNGYITITYSLYGNEEKEIKKRLDDIILPPMSECKFTDTSFIMALKSRLTDEDLFQRYIEGRVIMNELIDWKLD